MNTVKRALVVLAAYDFESLGATLKALEHTVSPDEKIVVVLNGNRYSLNGEKTERVARTWAAQHPSGRFAVRPLCSGGTAYAALTEAIMHYGPLKDVEHICKIDDDLIPVKKGWLDHLSQVYNQLARNRKMGFVTGLINNNCWGFDELLTVFDKRAEYEQAFNYYTLAGDGNKRKVAAGKVDTGEYGTIWNYPYIAWWTHQWTTLNLKDFVEGTKGLGLKQIAADTHYSIGCIYFDKSVWLALDPVKYKNTFDELLLHNLCRDQGYEKWAVMDEPMVHLFYRTHRLVNAPIIDQLLPELAAFYSDEQFCQIERAKPQDMMQLAEESLTELKGKLGYIHRKISSISFMKKWREKRKQKELLMFQ